MSEEATRALHSSGSLEVISVLAVAWAPSLQHAELDGNQSSPFVPSPGILSSF